MGFNGEKTRAFSSLKKVSISAVSINTTDTLTGIFP